MVLIDGFSVDLILFEKADEMDFFILLLYCEFEVDLVALACTELFII